MSGKEQTEALTLGLVTGFKKSAEFLTMQADTWRKVGREERAKACDIAADELRKLADDTALALGDHGGKQ